MTGRAKKTEELFAMAVELPPAKRSQFVTSSCGDDHQLAVEVNRLLHFHNRNLESDFILDSPPVNAALPNETANSFAEIVEKEGDTISRYRLLEKIGEGGMGIVYMAEQIGGVRRRVALKIIKLGMDTRQVIARFEAERQAMAMFDHPCITRVFDAGSTSTGRPFFVMELVRGTNLIDFVESRKLALSERLCLFVDVCNAVQHAHQKGIIHRDLKPSNILVTLLDGVPSPKVIDFGIAKAIGHRLTDKTLFTRYSAMVGTPQYMSPEQAEMNGLDVDTRSDIYTLGVLLYELVTGTTPVPAESLQEVNPLALFETLRDADIERPSVRLARGLKETRDAAIDPSVEASEYSIGRGRSSQQHMPGKLKGELDWIVMKALSRDRTLRYASANELAEDVGRFLEGEAVLAAPPSKVYRAKSFFRRYKAAVISTAVISSVLLLSSIVCFWLAVKAHRSNLELTKLNNALVENVEQLEVAQATIRESVTSQMVRSAITIALSKFDYDMEDQIDKVAEELFPTFFDGEEEPDEFSVDFLLYGYCYDYDQSLILDIGNKALLGKQLGRIRPVIQENQLILDRVYNSEIEKVIDTQDFDAEYEHEHSPECVLVQRATDRELRRLRYQFYRHLVVEYRNLLGADNEIVAEAQIMLAASLLDSKDYDEAESQLNEAITIADASNVKIAKQLLRSIGNRRAARKGM